MKCPEAVVHIGLEKTGTTSIQKTLKVNIPTLEKNGVHFDCYFGSSAPGSSGNSVGLAMAAQDPKKWAKWRRGSRWTANSSFKEYQYLGSPNFRDLKKIIFSAEHLSSQLQEVSEIEKLSTFLHSIAHKVRVIAYIRRPDRFVHSLANEFVKAGGLFSFGDQGAVLRKIVDGGKVNFCRTLSSYVEVFGKNSVTIKVFDRRALLNGDVVDDFFSELGLSGCMFARVTQANSSQSREALYLYSMINDAGKSFVGSDDIRNALRDIIINGKGKSDFMTKSEAISLMRGLREEIEGLEASLSMKFFDEDFSNLPERRVAPDMDELRRLSTIPSVKRAIEKYVLGWTKL